MSGRKEGVLLRILNKLNNPPKWVEIVVGAIALIALPLSVFLLAINQAYKVQATIACCISGLFSLYAISMMVKYVIRLRRKLLKVAGRYAFTRNMLRYEYRSIFISACSFLGNIGYTFFLANVAFLYDSVWYGALSVYYIVLAASRGSMLVRNNKQERKYKFDRHGLQKAKIGTYRYCGITILALAAALAVSVVELLINGAGPRATDGIIIALAVLAVGKVVYGVMHFMRSTKSSDLVVRSVWYTNLAVTLVSILTLQTLILTAYPTNVEAMVVNGITGFSVCLITLALGAFMIVYSVHAKKRLLAVETQAVENVVVDTVDDREEDINEEN